MDSFRVLSGRGTAGLCWLLLGGGRMAEGWEEELGVKDPHARSLLL